MIEELERYVPDVLRAARAALAAAAPDLDFIRLGSAEFAAATDISIDYAIAEKSERTVVVPAAIGWSDIGSWSALWEAAPRDEAGNVAQGDVVLEGARNSFARSDGTLTTLLGVDNLVVVTTKDAVLVADRRETQNVKRIVDRLKRDARPEAETHNRVYRPWGFYESLIQGDRFQVKRIVVMPGHKLSLQKHHHRAEHWIVVAGIAVVTRDAEEHFVRENESIYLPLGCTHRLDNPGKIPLTLIEVQSGSYLGEDDIVRLEDTYGRS
jgi:mannose-1-phosphate guanylyltransferase/mannose-6-phosphate isomerase